MTRSISVTVTDKTGRQFPFTLYAEFISFMRTEEKFWTGACDSLEEPHSQIVSFGKNISSLLKSLEGWEASSTDKDDALFQREFTQNTKNVVNQMRGNWVWSGHDFSSAFLKCHEKYGSSAAETFLDYVAMRNISNINSTSAIQGAFSAFEYEREIGAAGSWADAQRASFDTLRDQLVSERSQLVTDIESLKDSLAAWQRDVDADWKGQVSRLRKLLSSQIKRRRAQLDSLTETRAQNFNQLEETYQERLRLKKPAEYWGKTAKNYRIEGGIFAAILIVFLLVGVFIFFDFYSKWLMGQTLGVSLTTLHGIAIISAGVALFAFLVRQLSKLTFSAYHLMRDAQEREQLAYFYLSLINEGAIDEESRSIVLQALFSRTDSGLLGSESGPTMPSMAADALRVASRHRTT